MNFVDPPQMLTTYKLLLQIGTVIRMYSKSYIHIVIQLNIN